MFIRPDKVRTRAYTVALLDMVDQGIIDRDSLIQDLLGWMSEDEVARFARSNEYILEESHND